MCQGLKMAWSLLVETHWKLCPANCYAWNLSYSVVRPGWACVPLTPPVSWWRWLVGFGGLFGFCIWSKHLVLCVLFSTFAMCFCRWNPHRQIQNFFLNIAIPQVNPYFQNKYNSDTYCSSGFSSASSNRPWLATLLDMVVSPQAQAQRTPRFYFYCFVLS